jgi:hypothetical protein
MGPALTALVFTVPTLKALLSRALPHNPCPITSSLITFVLALLIVLLPSRCLHYGVLLSLRCLLKVFVSIPHIDNHLDAATCRRLRARDHGPRGDQNLMLLVLNVFVLVILTVEIVIVALFVA